MKVIIGVSGASGIILAKRLLEALKEKKIETHLVISDSAKKVSELEGIKPAELEKLADFKYKPDDFSASIASGSFKTDGMAVVPCSMKTLGGLASGYSDNLILRAGDVCMKEGRKLILVARETPLSYIHLKNMSTLKKAGAVILPPVLAYYNSPKTLADMENFITGKILDALGVENSIYKRWK